MKVAIVGSRKWPKDQNYKIIDYINALPDDTEVVSGHAVGVDLLAEETAEARGLKVKSFPVTKEDWSRYGLGAGKRRNGFIIAYAERVVAFWAKGSGGTENSIFRARAAGKHVEIIYPDEETL